MNITRAAIAFLLLACLPARGHAGHSAEGSAGNEPAPSRQPIELEAGLAVRPISSTAYVVTHSFPWPANSLLVAMASSAEPTAQPLLEVDGFTAPATVTASDALSPAVDFQRSWTREEGGITLSMIEVRPRKPCTLARYLARWRRDHACTAKPVKGFGTLASLGPSITVAGTCEGGNRYIMHVVKLQDAFVELHADSSIMGPGPALLQKALRDLIDTARSRKPAPPRTRD